ncbi:hypothetical protein C8R44DRAFT_809004 [Mycena epipterygia]|nr:hypothetical protein C8R44DRAFT_809004 [Mycena epipterygia]
MSFLVLSVLHFCLWLPSCAASHVLRPLLSGIPALCHINMPYVAPSSRAVSCFLAICGPPSRCVIPLLMICVAFSYLSRCRASSELW